MKKKVVLLFIFCFFGLTETAWSILPDGIKKIRYGLNYSSSEKLWKAKDAPIKYYNNDGKASMLAHSLEYAQGFKYNIELNAKVTYSKTEMLEGSEGGTTKGDTRSGISNISIFGSKLLFQRGNFRSTGLVGIKHPFYEGPSSDYNESPDVFIAPNDGSIHYILGLTPSYSLTKRINLQSDFRYMVRSGEPKDQYTIDFIASYFASEKFTLGVGYNFLRTLGGPDIGTPGFSRQVQLRSGGNSKVKAFSVVKEYRDGMSLFLAYAPNIKYLIDLYYNKVLDGRNTDSSQSIGLGFSYFF